MVETLYEIARRTDGTIARARAELVRAVRQAAADGMTQIEIAEEIGRSQPEVSRILRFHGTSPLGRVVRRHSVSIRQALRDVGGRNVRVFGSVARGTDTPTSDIDILFTMDRPLSLMELARVETRLEEIVGTEVDLVPESSLQPVMRDRIISEAVTL